MQFIVNLFGTVHATKDIGKQAAAGISILDEKLRILSNHVDFLLQQHFSRPQQCCELKTYEVYTSDDDGPEGEDREGGGSTAAATGTEEDGRRPDQPNANVSEGDSQGNGPVEGQAGTGSGEASSAPAGPNPAHSD